MERKFVVAIDVDGTILEHKFPDLGKLLPDAKEVINDLYDEGCYIIIWTCRSGFELNEIRTFLDYSCIKYHAVNTNAPFDMIGFMPSPKIFYDLIIDDKNLGGLPDWKTIYKMVIEAKKKFDNE